MNSNELDEFCDAETNLRNSVLVVKAMAEIKWWEDTKIEFPHDHLTVAGQIEVIRDFLVLLLEKN